MMCVTGAVEALMVGASEKKENAMSRIITVSELSHKSLAELHALYRQVQLALAQAQPGTEAHRHAVASLDAVSRMIRLRQQAPAPRF